jgi:Flp pilus assembly protein TadD
MPGLRLWGLNHLAYFENPLWMIFAAVPLLVLIPAVNRRFVQFLKWIATFLAESRKRRIVSLSVLIAIGAVVFIVLRQKTHFLGDGYRWIGNLQKDTSWSKWSEPVEIALHLALFRILNPAIKDAALVSYQVFSFLAGALYIPLALSIGRYLGRSNGESLLITAILLSTGATLMFFGYAEHYALSYVAIMASLYHGIRYADASGQWHLYASIALSGVAISLHLVSLMLVPICLYLTIAARPYGSLWSKLPVSARRVIAGVILACVIGFVAVTEADLMPFSGIFLPLFIQKAGNPAPGVFSGTHFADLLNVIVLAADILIPLGLLTAAFRHSELRSRGGFRYLLFASCVQLCFLLYIDPKLGAACDWDFLMPATSAGILLGIYTLAKAAYSDSIRQYILAAVAVSMLCGVVPWWVLNSSERKSVQRYTNLINMDWEQNRAGRVILRSYLQVKGDTAAAAREDEIIREEFPGYHYAEAAKDAYDAGNLELAEAFCDSALAIDSLNPGARNIEGMICLERGDLELARHHLQIAADRQPKSPSIRYNLGVALFKSGERESARRELEKAVELDSGSPEAWATLASIYSAIGMLHKSRDGFVRALELDSTYAESYFRLAKVLEALGDTGGASASYQAFIRFSEDSSEIHEAERSLKPLMDR